MSTRCHRSLLLLLAALAVAACTPVRMLNREIAVSVEQFQDLPVPAAFRLVDDHHESHTLRVGEYRFASLQYRGTAPVDEVVSYLMQRLPQHAWQVVSRTSDSPEQQQVVVERPGYRAHYSVQREESITFIDVELRSILPERA